MRYRRFAIAVAALALAPCCGGEVARSTDGNTSWLSCKEQGCADGYECVRDRCVVAKAMPIAARDGGSVPLEQPTPTASVSMAQPTPTASVSTAPAPTAVDSGLAGCTRLSNPLGGKGPAVSFRSDILPIFGLGCVTSDCHRPQDAKAGLNLGYPCNYDPSAKWKCSFPAVSNQTLPQLEDEATVAAVYASLLAPAQTVKSPTVYRVRPGDPENSFLVLSLANQQNSRGYVCTNLDPSHETNPPACGVSMPQGSDLFCTGSSQPRFDAIVAWIAQGAPNN